MAHKPSCEGLPKRLGFQARPHQLIARDRMYEIMQDKTLMRGLYLYHKLGSGKTCTYAGIIDDYIDLYPDNKVIILTPGSLRPNMVTEYCTFCGKHGDKMKQKFTYYSFNASNIRTTLDPVNFDDSLIIVDEAHDVINGASNQSTQLEAVYNKIHTSQRSFVVLGSGTPVVNHFQELALIINLLYILDIGNQIPPLFAQRPSPGGTTDMYQPLSPEVIRYTMEILQPVISHFPGEEQGVYPDVTEHFEVVDLNSIKQLQYSKYLGWERLPVNVDRRNAVAMDLAVRMQYNQDKAQQFLKNAKILSREYANYAYPPLQGDKTAKELGLPDKTKERGGWVDFDIFDSLDRYGEKIVLILRDILTHDYKHAIYTCFKTYHGSELLSAMLTTLGISNRTFDGDMSDVQRRDILNEFNAPDNLHGEKIKVLIFTDAGSQGISLYEVRKLHIVEQYIGYHIIKQVKGRVVRRGSHMRLPPDERNVTIVNYIIDVTNAYLTAGEASGDMVSNSCDMDSYRKAMLKEKRLSIIFDLFDSLPT